MASSNGRARSPVSLVGSDADVAFYRRQLAQLGAPVLVLGCANGRLAWKLCAAVPLVVGVDPSPVMIAFAEEGRTQQPPETAGRVRFLSADLRSLRLVDKFGAVLAPHNALALMPSLLELEAVIATARHHLSPGGVLLFDAINPRRASERGVDADESNPPLDLWTHRPAFAPHLRERQRTGHSPSSAIRRLRLRHFSPRELDAALEDGGFVATARYGRYDEKPFDPEDPLQIVVASLRER
jgi:SAM-dependent methyltransferase